MHFLPHAIDPSMGLGLGIHAEDGRKKCITSPRLLSKTLLAEWH